MKRRLCSIAALALVFCPAAGYADERPGAGPTVRTESGQIFMEETTAPAGKPAGMPAVPLDMSSVGVRVNPEGRIIPLIDRGQPPVQMPGSTLEVYDEPWWLFVPPANFWNASPWYYNPWLSGARGGLNNVSGWPVDVFGRPLPGYAPYYPGPAAPWAQGFAPFGWPAPW